MKKRVLVVHGLVRPHGGGQSVAAWTLEALKDTCEVSLLTWSAVDYEAVNRFFGTNLRGDRVRVYQMPALAHRLLEFSPTPMAMARSAILQRACQRLLRRVPFDAVISTDNEMDFGRRGIQYVHFPRAYLPRPNTDLRWYHSAGSVASYRGFCSLLARTSVRRLRANLTLANSGFIAGKIREAHGVDSLTLFPPVPGGFPDVPWSARHDAFVGIGRFAPEKRWEQAVEIVRRVRDGGRDVRLTLIATHDHPDCERRVRQLAYRYPWFTLHTNLPRREMVGIVARHRYGIHLMEDEHFGIAPAEEQCGGCLPFVHRSGGPMEIVGHDDRLMFRTTGEAVDRIGAVLASPDLQAELCRGARQRAGLYSSEQFAARMREIVGAFTDGEPRNRPGRNYVACPSGT